MAWARPLSLLVLCAIGLGCAAKSAGPACSSEADRSLGFAVYQECAVSTGARQVSTPPRLDYTPNVVRSCLSAVIEFVVDSSGMPRPETAKIVRTNDMGFANAHLSKLSQYKYAPAKKDGLPVAQLVRMEQKAVAFVVSSTSPRPSRAAARSEGLKC